MKVQFNRDQLSLIYEFGIKTTVDGQTYYVMPQIFRTCHDGSTVEVLTNKSIERPIMDKINETIKGYKQTCNKDTYSDNTKDGLHKNKRWKGDYRGYRNSL
jgi:hypothetical protein